MSRYVLPLVMVIAVSCVLILAIAKTSIICINFIILKLA